MSTNIRNWLNASLEENKEAPVKIQEGETPKEDFSTATNEDSGDVDTDKPATAKIDAASDGDEKGKDIDQGHQEVHVPDNDGKVSNEDASDDAAASEEAVSTESSEEEKKDDIDGEDDEKPKHDDSKEVDPDSQHEADVEKPVEAELKTPETGDDQDTPEADDNVKADPKGAQTDEVSSEDHHEAVEQEDAPAPVEAPEAPVEEEDAQVEGDETPETPAEDDVEAVDDMEDDLQAVAKIESDIDHFERVSESLERYYDILSRGMDVNDGVSGETADAIRIGLENLDPMFQEEEVIPAMEAFGQISSRHTATYISMESLSGKMKTVVEATKRAIAKLFEMLYDLWTKVSGGAARAKKRVAKLGARLEDLKGDASVQTEISGSAKLNIGTQFMGNDPRGVAAIEDVAEYVYNDYPRIATGIAADTAKIFTDMERSFRGLMGGSKEAMNDINVGLIKAMDDFPQVIKRHLQKLPNQTQAQSNELPPKYARVQGVMRSHRLPGDYAMVQYIVQKIPAKVTDERGQAATTMLEFNKVFNVGFEKLQGSSKAGKETYRVPSIREMTEIGKRIEAVLKLTDKGVENKEAYKNAKKHMDEAADTVAKTFYQLPRFANPLVSGINNMSRILTQPAGHFNGYVISTINAYLAVLEHNIDELAKQVGTESGKTVNGKAEEAKSSDSTSMVPA